MINSYAQAQEVNLKKKDCFWDGNDKQVRMSTGEPLKNEEMFRYEKGKQVRTYADVVSTGELSNERERGKYFK